MKPIIYQVFTRLFGNATMTRKPGGALQENGCGKFADFTPKALNSIHGMGATHVWYTGVIRHASRTDYSIHGLPLAHPGIVKGEAGSPYAITDYYDVCPDLAGNPDKRMTEFEKMVQRTHKSGLGVIIDFVPNHVSRAYCSACRPKGIGDLGEKDNKAHAFSPRNNFYYIPNATVRLGHPDTAAPYEETPAKATGNDRFDAYPQVNDWYETVKLNYGVDYCGGGATHFSPIPDTWKKMLHILLFWAEKGIDGFRCDMAEMVPVAFWNYAIGRVKKQYPNVLFIAEVYNPHLYGSYIESGRFDYLYDKVGLYDTLRAVVCGHASARSITAAWQSSDGLQSHLLNFLENHDEQRIASDFFAGEARKALPALIVSATINVGPYMLYFGQELGERGMDCEGFSGMDGRTTIFDYWTLPALIRWQNDGKYNAAALLPDERELRAYYARVMHLCHEEEAISEGQFYDLMYVNPDAPAFDGNRTYAYLRKHKQTLLLCVVNFSDADCKQDIRIPQHAFEYLQIPQSAQRTRTAATDLLTRKKLTCSLLPDHPIALTLPAYGGCIIKFDVSV